MEKSRNKTTWCYRKANSTVPLGLSLLTPGNGSRKEMSRHFIHFQIKLWLCTTAPSRCTVSHNWLTSCLSPMVLVSEGSGLYCSNPSLASRNKFPEVTERVNACAVCFSSWIHKLAWCICGLQGKERPKRREQSTPHPFFLFSPARTLSSPVQARLSRIQCATPAPGRAQTHVEKDRGTFTGHGDQQESTLLPGQKLKVSGARYTGRFYSRGDRN